MHKITTHLWFDKEAKEAAKFYTTLFPDSKVTNISTFHNTPSGDVDVVSFELSGLSFMAISAGPLFKFNPSVSFHVKCKTIEEVDALWKKLVMGGKVLMELGKYPFSERYGWLSDKYSLSWQIIFAGGQEFKQKITPVVMFVGNVCGKTEEAVNFYTSVFSARGGQGTTKVDNVLHYGKGEGPDKEGTVKYASFILEGQEFGAMDSAYDHKFALNEAISFIVHCKTQEEIDYFWGRLSAVPESEQCGWLKDKFGVSWQVVPTGMEKMLQDPDKKKVARVTETFLKMKKIDLGKLEKAAGEY